MDIIDFIEHNLSKEVSHRHIVRKMKKLGLPYSGSKRFLFL